MFFYVHLCIDFGERDREMDREREKERKRKREREKEKERGSVHIFYTQCMIRNVFCVKCVRVCTSVISVCVFVFVYYVPAVPISWMERQSAGSISSI